MFNFTYAIIGVLIGMAVEPVVIMEYNEDGTIEYEKDY
jgi:hypothetical protein